MIIRQKHLLRVAAWAMLPCAAVAAAQGLGSIRGVAVVGVPLDVVVEAALPTDDPADVCAKASVRDGEVWAPASEVQLVAEANRPGQQGLRVRTRNAIQEPVVTLRVSVGCATTFMREYVLLPEFRTLASATVPAAVATDGAAGSMATRPGAATLGTPQPALDASPSLTSDAAGGQRARRVLAQRPVRVATGQPSTRTRVTWQQRLDAAWNSTVDAGSTAARLQVEPLTFEDDAAFIQFLISRGLGQVLEEDNQRQRERDELLQVQQQWQQAQQELAAVRARNQELLAQLQDVTQQSQWLRLAAMFAVVLVTAGAAVWWYRRRQQVRTPSVWTQWLHTVRSRRWEPPITLSGAQPTTDDSAPAPAEVAPQPLSVSLSDETATAAPAALAQPTGSPAKDAAEHTVRSSDAVDPPVSVAPLDFAALHELWERVAFFEDLGQAADAVAALRSFVLAHPRASEAPYLRWWHIAKLGGLDVRLAQVTYEQHFHRLLAPDDGRATLLDDGALLQALQAHWPGAEARHLIETALASQPGDPGSPLQVRTVAAFDDLITLHGMLDLLPLLPLTEGTAPAADDDHVIDFDFSGWQPPGAPAAPDGKSAS